VSAEVIASCSTFFVFFCFLDKLAGMHRIRFMETFSKIRKHWPMINLQLVEAQILRSVLDWTNRGCTISVLFSPNEAWFL
jgi:hypothetical protein